MTNKIFAFLTAKEENPQALLFEELDDSQASAVTGGLAFDFNADLTDKEKRILKLFGSRRFDRV